MLWRQAGVHPRNVPSSAATPAFQPCNSCPAPDIYFLLFDEYNSSLDSFLVHEGFHIQPDSRSNYYMTPFSMASMFNSTYLDLRDPKNLTNSDYLDMLSPGRPAAALDILAQQGYTIINHSPFDLPGHSATIQQTFIVSGVRLITRSTLLDCMASDMGWRWRNGFRYPPFADGNQRMFFNNQNAVYYPDGDYRLLYDSISAVNEFRWSSINSFGNRSLY